MPAIQLQCTCGQKLKSSSEVLGEESICPACGRSLRVVAGSLPEGEKLRFAARLVITRGPTRKAEQIVFGGPEPVMAGRGACPLILLGERVSRRHAQLVPTASVESGWALQDCGSRNGLYLNGKRVTGSRPLSHGDLLGIGEYELRFLADPVTPLPAGAMVTAQPTGEVDALPGAALASAAPPSSGQSPSVAAASYGLDIPESGDPNASLSPPTDDAPPVGASGAGPGTLTDALAHRAKQASSDSTSGGSLDAQADTATRDAATPASDAANQPAAPAHRLDLAASVNEPPSAESSNAPLAEADDEDITITGDDEELSLDGLDNDTESAPASAQAAARTAPAHAAPAHAAPRAPAAPDPAASEPDQEPQLDPEAELPMLAAANPIELRKAGVNPKPASENERRSGPTCQACARHLPKDSQACPACGIYLDSGRPVLDPPFDDAEELEVLCRRHVRQNMPSPVGFSALDVEIPQRHFPWAIWTVVGVIVVASAAFWYLDASGAPAMRHAKTAMLWTGSVEDLSGYEIRELYEQNPHWGDDERLEQEVVQEIEEELKLLTPEDRDLVLEVNDYRDPDYWNWKLAKDEDIEAAFKRIPPGDRPVGQFGFHQLLSYGWLHTGPWHLALVVISLMWLGPRVNQWLGHQLTAGLLVGLLLAGGLAQVVAGSLGGVKATGGADALALGVAAVFLVIFPIQWFAWSVWLKAGRLLVMPYQVMRGAWGAGFAIAVWLTWYAVHGSAGGLPAAGVTGLVLGVVTAGAMLVSKRWHNRNRDLMSVVFGSAAWEMVGSPARWSPAPQEAPVG